MLENVLKEAFAKAKLNDKHIQQNELAKICDVSESQISKILSGNVIPNEDIVRKFAKACNANEELLVTARWLQSAPKEIIPKIDNLINYLIEFERKTFLDNKDIISEEVFEKAKKEILKMKREEIFLDFLNTSCSNVYKNLNNIKIIDNEEKVIINSNINTMIQIEDNYMYPIIPINSYINIKVCEKYKNNDIIYVSYKGQKFCRGLIIINASTLFLYSLNGNNNFIVDKNSSNDFSIIGKVTQVTIDI